MRIPTWAVLSPAPIEDLRREAEEFGASEDFEPLEVLAGRGSYGAILEYEPGVEDSGEAELAATLSRAHRGKHYVLHFSENAPWVAEFEGGTRRAVLKESPFAVAARLGVPIEDAPSTKAKEGTQNALVIEGHEPDKVAATLDVPAAGRRGVRFDPVPLGTLVRTDEPDPRLGGWAYELSAALGARVYSCSWFPEWGEFLCDAYERGKKTARFAWPPEEEPDDLATPSILGQTTPEGLVRALGIPWVLRRA